jgi:hypothetical protein
MPKKSAARKAVVVSDASDEDCSAKGDGAKVEQWVVKIVAMARDGDGHAYFLVRWGADDEGKPFAVGKEEETWEPSEHVQACPDALNRFHEASRLPLPSEKDAMQSELERQVAQLTTPGQASKGEAGAGAGLPTDAATAFLASFASLIAVTDDIRAVGDKSKLLPEESVAHCPASPMILTPRKPDYDDYGDAEDLLNHTTSTQRSFGQVAEDALQYAGQDLLASPGGKCATACLRQSPESPCLSSPSHLTLSGRSQANPQSEEDL